ncbi:MAG: glutamate--tRNA ligase [Firmicutes bacterium]|nr:glutamate--tRNA ligase [Bacillota bacterium]
MKPVRVKPVRVRFAPSPTGYLHVGGARTALFNWLFARHHGGRFILRIEDTDVARSTEASTGAIIESMRWLGLDWDEGPVVGGDYGPYFQSERLQVYREHMDRLIENGNAYYCYCTPEELEERRKEAVARGEVPRYDGRCRDLSPSQIRRFQDEGRRVSVRFMVPEGETLIHDLIRGEVKFSNSSVDDFVIMKSDGFPTYNFAAVVDDSLMGMTHIIRAEEHLPNTPKQVMIYRALGYPLPEFAHVPMILGPDRSKLSKRHGATSVTQYRDMGYLPEALVNYLALLGWAYDAEHEIFSTEELIEKFSLEGVSKNAAIFDPKKLEWMNGQYIRMADPDRIMRLAIPFLQSGGLLPEKASKASAGGAKDEEEVDSGVSRVIQLFKDRMKTVKDIVELADYFFTDNIRYDEAAVKKFLARPRLAGIFGELIERLGRLEPFTQEGIEAVMRGLAAELGLKAGDVIHPTRVALTGRAVSPGLFEVMEVLGKETVLKRLAATRDKLER